MPPSSRVRILVDARLASGSPGGVEQALVGMATSFKEANFSDLEFSWLVNSDDSQWLMPFVPEGSFWIEAGSPAAKSAWVTWLIAQVRGNPLGDWLASFFRSNGPFKYLIPKSPEVLKDLNFDLIHFPTQYGFQTTLPNIYQPHDLQHFHLPQYFSKENLAIRRTGYKFMMDQASIVVVGNEWTKADFKSVYPEIAKKLYNVPVYTRTLNVDFSNSLLNNLTLGDYLLYPASYWPHKNHKKLLEVFAHVIELGYNVKLALSGARLQENQEIRKLVYDLGLEKYVQILGYLSSSDLASLYHHAKLIIMPSLFESESLPVWEAFAVGVPIVASRITAIPAQVNDAAILFDPLSSEEMEDAVIAILDDLVLAQELVAKGKRRFADFSSSNSAYGYRYVYRKALSLKNDDADTFWENNGFRF